MGRISWKKRMQVADDKHQSRLAPEPDKPRGRRELGISVEYRLEDPPLMCPFCLYVARLARFREKTRRGFSERRARCPDCGNLMQMRTLTRTMTVEEYAEWVYAYSASGFWQKCPFEKFKARMRRLGWSYRFWRRYKALRGEGAEDTYEAHLSREQEEWAREEGYM